MVKILQIETATQVCSVALSVDGNTVAFKEETAQNIHAAKLTLFIDDVMRRAGLTYADLDAVAVSKGPGSYTGLRIGVSTAKGLCFALDKPLIAINTLRMMAKGHQLIYPGFSGLICPMIDARRMEVFMAIYNDKLEEVEPTQAKVLDDQSFASHLQQNNIAFLGDGSPKFNSYVGNEKATFFVDNFNSANFMSNLAYEAFMQNKFEDVAYFEPFYLKDFVFTTPKKKV